MQRFLILAAALTACATASQANIVSWNGDSGVPPWDGSVPLEGRFSVGGLISAATYGNGLVNISDTSTSEKVAINKWPVVTGVSWAFQIELRMNSHHRHTLDWGDGTGVYDGVRQCSLQIARNGVGFSGANGDSFIDAQVVGLNTTDSFHVYRVLNDQGMIHLFVDTFDAPALTIPYSHLPFDGRSPEVFLAGTSSGGVANFDVRSFAFNLDGTDVPEPSAGLVVSVAALVMLRRRRYAA